MKLNLGCGFNKIPGFINVDRVSACDPDKLIDLDVTPWPFVTDSVDEVLFNHSLERLGQTTTGFFEIMKELYRICKVGAVVEINSTHPRHDLFINDPTCVRTISPESLSLFSKKLNDDWKKSQATNSVLALYLNVNFEIRKVVTVLEKRYMDQVGQKKITEEELKELVSERNNVILENRITLEVLK